MKNAHLGALEVSGSHDRGKEGGTLIGRLLTSSAMWAEEIVAGRPAWVHEASGVVFREVPAGTFLMGLSDAEAKVLRKIEKKGGVESTLEPLLDAARAWGPARRVSVGSFLIARHPLTVAQVRHFVPDYEDDLIEDDNTAARVDEDLVDDVLEALPFRLPTEAEWEFAARAGTATLTHRGNDKPGEDMLIDEFGDEERTAAAENPFGLAGFGSAAEICAERWSPDETRVVRGGAADCHPWQGCDEWTLLLPASRAELSYFAGIRPATSVPPQT